MKKARTNASPAPTSITPLDGPTTVEPQLLQPQPLLRASFTVANPCYDSAATIQVVILAVGEESANLARRDDLPELKEAGWSFAAHDDITIYFRTVS